MRQIILDTETTGLDPKDGHRLTEIGCLEMINRRLTGRRFHTYLNPEREIDKAAAEITGLTLEFLADKPRFIEIADEFVNFLLESETELIIHNAAFDMGFLNHELHRLNHVKKPLENHVSVVDTLLMARRLHPGQRNSLDALCKRYNVDNTHRDLHGALLDAELLAKVYLLMTAGQAMMSLNDEPIQRTVSELKVQIKNVERNQAALTIIHASEAENQLHEAWLKKYQKEE